MPERVLLLGDDLRAFLTIARSLGRREVEVHAAPSDFSSPALRSRFIAGAHRLPPYPLDPARWEAELARLIAERRFRFVVPTSDSGLFMLRRHAKALGRRHVGIAECLLRLRLAGLPVEIGSAGYTEWRLRQMSPDFAAEVVTLPDAETGPAGFEAIAAAINRLASVTEQRFCAADRPAEPLAHAPPARPQAA